MPIDARPSNDGQPELPVRALWQRRVKGFRAFLKTLVFKHDAQAASMLILNATEGRDASRTRLQQCCEWALDAHTVEDAIFWHSEVINEISVEIYSIATKPWPDGRKQQALAELTDLQNRHGVILHRLTGIVARNEQVIWHPSGSAKSSDTAP